MMRTEHGENNVVETGTGNADVMDAVDAHPSAWKRVASESNRGDGEPSALYYRQDCRYGSVSDDCIYRNIHSLTSTYGSIIDLTMKQDNGTITKEERRALHSILILESMLDPISDDEMGILMGDSLEMPETQHYRMP